MSMIVNKYSYSLFLLFMTMMSYPFFLKTMSNPMVVFLFFFHGVWFLLLRMNF